MSTTRRGFIASLRGLLPLAAIAAAGAEVAPKAKADANLIAVPVLHCPHCDFCMYTGGFGFTDAARSGRFIEVKHPIRQGCPHSGKEWRLPYSEISVEVFK